MTKLAAASRVRAEMPYRDEKHALEEYRDRLRGQLDDALREAQKVEPLGRELAETERLLRRAVTRDRTQTTVDGARVASPCKADWDAMIGDDRVRHCCHCNKDVYNLSAMTSAEASALIGRYDRPGQAGPCVRLYRRADGTVMTADCPVGARRKRRRLAVIGTAGGGVLAAAALVSHPAPKAVVPEAASARAVPQIVTIGVELEAERSGSEGLEMGLLVPQGLQPRGSRQRGRLTPRGPE